MSNGWSIVGISVPPTKIPPSFERPFSRTIQRRRGSKKVSFQEILPSFRCRHWTHSLRTRICEAKTPIAPVALSTLQTTYEVFEGLDGPDIPVGICETRSLPPAISLEEAVATLYATVVKLETNCPLPENGTIRFQVPLPPGLKALQWLQSQPQNPYTLPRSYFSPREARENSSGENTNGNGKQYFKLDASGVAGVAGIGAAVLFNGSKPFSMKDWKAIKRFLSKSHPIIRAYGGMRFDPRMEPSNEWRSFGSFYFFIPQMEFCECEGCSLLAVTLTWDKVMGWTMTNAVQKTLTVLDMVSTRICPDNERMLAQVLHREHVPDEQSWHAAVSETLVSLGNHEVEHLDSPHHGMTSSLGFAQPALSKVVMARRTKLEMNDKLDPVSLLACLQDKDPSAYQFFIQVPDGSAFVGCSPERLFARDGLLVAGEAVAGTRGRGSTAIKDQQLGMELMLSTKDHFEFEIVRESVQRNMEMVCKHVKIECSKSLLKQARVQHLYARFNGELCDEAAEFDILSVLHPTPAVCGHPQAAAREAISNSEAFDRGFYAGPVGWFGGDGAEFAVGIRSSLIQPWSGNRLRNECNTGSSPSLAGEQSLRSEFQNDLEQNLRSETENDLDLSKPSSLGHQVPRPNATQEMGKGTCVFLYAGVGIVKDSVSTSEWRELELKTSQFETLLEQRQPLEKVVNINALWAILIVEECCRLGITYFCIAPGSRSSPIAAAAAANPRVTCVSCIDERSMAFHAVGYGRGANKAAAVVTSSGTAVSNLLPAVVEASEDFVPLVVLTADRPPELYDSGANQTIDQGKHFGGFVRYHANLPAADDKLPAKMVLTTVDAAVNRAMIAPSGPVHINCAFREPLAGTPAAWSTACLKGLERWTATSMPYTQYIDSKPRLVGGLHPTFVADLDGVTRLITGAKEGLLVVGGLSAAEETWAVALLAQHLGWPVIPDVISGLRIGEVLCTGGVGERKVNIIHNFDQILLSQAVVQSSKPDVVLQVGSRLTSKRLSAFLESANLSAYILVEEHSSRHDPAHVITHRIQCSATDFSSTIMKVTESRKPTPFCGQLQILSEVVEREVQFKLQAESSLTEPFVAHYVVSCLPSGSALFLGNSMPIRDVDMYAHGAIKVLGTCKYEVSWDQALPHIGARVGANRGASGIDGVVSTAIGFAAGSRQRVTLLLGDVSFLHDTNGLALLSERPGQPPVTIVVVNNGGGGIFSLLPIADTIPEDTFSALFSTPHTVDLKKLCQAHRVDHCLIQSKEELKIALQSLHGSPLNCVIEVESKIEDNADFHRFLNCSIGQAVTRAFNVVSMFPLQLGDSSGDGLRILEAKYNHHSFALLSPTTTRIKHSSSGEILRRGFLLYITLANGSSGIGEIAPLQGLHRENLVDVEEQLRVVALKLQGCLLHTTLPLMDGHFSSWLSEVVGIQDYTLFPSVRMGLEMAVFGALAASWRCSLSELLSGVCHSRCLGESIAGSSCNNSNVTVRVCGLLDHDGSPEEAADGAIQLVKEGFCTLKLKVGRRKSPLEDAAMLKVVRERVGPSINLRVDANRKWLYEEAVDFANSVKSCGLQYIEEPVRNPLDIPRFFQETGLPVALDESLDEDYLNIGERLELYASQGVIAVVIKPGCVGGFEKSWQIAQWAQTCGMTVVISSAFESSISLAAYSQFAAYVDGCVRNAATNAMKCEGKSKQNIPVVAHGFGTYKWLNDNMVLPVKSTGNSVEICSKDAAAYLQQLLYTNAVMASEVNTAMASNVKGEMNAVMASHVNRETTTYNVNVHCSQGSYSFRVLESAIVPSMSACRAPTIVFLHGFLGTSEDWLPVMHGLSITARCISIDLPGHGQTTVKEAEVGQPICSGQGEASTCVGQHSSIAETQSAWSMGGLGTALADLLTKLAEGQKVILVGYSMGARIAMYMALRQSEQIAGAVVVSGCPGLLDMSAQMERAAQDDALAKSLLDNGLQQFVDFWYTQPLWKSLRAHPNFELVKKSRLDHQDVYYLAKALASFSTGRQASLWEELTHCDVPILMVVGELDTKFVNIAHQVVSKLSAGACSELTNLGNKQTEELPASVVHVAKATDQVQAEGFGRCVVRLLEVEACGHAVHIESPLKLVKAVREFALASSGCLGY